MTPNSPDEAIHFRGKTLTPESPRPLHVPEPSNIPVLENQMDPVFNDTSTYDKPANSQSEQIIFQRVDNSQNGHEEAGHGLAPTSELANAPTPDSQPNAVNLALPTELNVSPPGSANGSTIPRDEVSSSNDINATQSGSGKVETGVDFQTLLDNLSSSASAAPPGPVVSATTSYPTNNSVLQEHEPPSASILNSTYAGLPPRPPTQELPDPNSNYPSLEDNSDYHRLYTQASSSAAHVSQPRGEDQYSIATSFAPGAAPGTSSGANGLPPPPVATFQQRTPQKLNLSPEGSVPTSHKGSRADRIGKRSSNAGDDEAPWGPEVQKIYDEFLREERVYVTEGLWDRFPAGSRLFVGNLPTERVTKRDLFHVFHKYGKLAQISIKQAYGFIQFLDANSCQQALQAQQGGLVRGRKIHLEISKPQKNTRPGPGHSESTRAAPSRRSRSPSDYSRGGTSNARGGRNQGGDRHDRSYDGKRGSFNDFRDEHAPRQRRDDYRPPRSPSPRPFRNRDGGFRSRDRTPERFDRRDRRRSRSPYSRDRRFRSPSPRGRPTYENESEPAFSRRALRDVPDLQILAADDVEMSFVYHVENSFKTRGLRTNVLVLSRIPMDVEIQRQMEDGVSAVVKLTRSQQYSGKVTLLVFDRSVGGGNKPRSHEYPDLDLHVAVEMTVQFQSVRRAGVTQAYYPTSPTFPVPSSLPNQYPQAIPHVQPAIPAVPVPQPNQLANLISTLDGPALQSLLNTLQQAQSVPQAQPSIPVAPNAANPVDLASLLNNAQRQQTSLATGQNQGAPQPHAATNQFGLPLATQLSGRPDPNLLALLAKSAGNGNPAQGQAQVGPNVQNIVNQLAKWKQ